MSEWPAIFTVNKKIYEFLDKKNYFTVNFPTPSSRDVDLHNQWREQTFPREHSRLPVQIV